MAATSKSRRNDPADAEDAVTLHVGRDELIIRQRYETASIINDLLIGMWFLVGSLLFLSSSLAHVGTWLFIIGSVEMLIRPAIRFARRVHLQRYHSTAPSVGEASGDF